MLDDAVLTRPPVADLPTAELVAHIISRYHDRHRRQFPEAIALARKVEAVHAGDPAAPVGLADHLAEMADRLEGHQQKEERILFPLLLNGGGSMAGPPMARMSMEHRDVGEELEQLAGLTRQYDAPVGACGAWRALIEACRTIRDDLMDHMALEDGVLFARFAGGR